MKHFIAILAGCVLLFVVVCPITPTPIAVPGGKALSVQAPIVAFTAVAVTLLLHSERPLGNVSAFEPGGVSTMAIVDLTCARLC